MGDVLALDPERRDNARLMADCARLGYLAGKVADVTFNAGRFWTEVEPPVLRFDADPQWQVPVADFRRLPLRSGCLDAIVLDPPFKLAGTSTGVGPGALDAGYGVGLGGYRSVAQIHQLIQDGIDEAHRVLVRGGLLLLKCQPQQNAARMNDQPGMFAERAVASGLWRDVDRLHVLTTPRKQPGVQRTARSNVSTLVVLRSRRAPRRRKNIPAGVAHTTGVR